MDALSTPSVRRRLAAMLYEALLVLALLLTSTLLFLFAFGWLDKPLRDALLGLYLFAVMGLYFTWFWTHGGQTLAMKTWRVRLESAGGGPVKPMQAGLRFLLSWVWFLPGLGAAWALGYKDVKDRWSIMALLGANILVWALTAFLDPARQYLHDRLAGTRLLQTPGKS